MKTPRIKKKDQITRFELANPVFKKWDLIKGGKGVKGIIYKVETLNLATIASVYPYRTWKPAFIERIHFWFTKLYLRNR